MSSNLYELVFDSIICLLWAILNWIDVVLVALTSVYKNMISLPSSSSSAAGGTETTTPKNQVVIIGASFAGLSVQRELVAHSAGNHLDITIVDYKTYFEYTPGILRCFVDPRHYQKHLVVPLSSLETTTTTTNSNSRTRVVVGEVTNVTVAEADESSSSSSSNKKGQHENRVILKDGRTLPFDYLVLATGSSYPGPIKATTDERTIAERQVQWDLAASKLEAAQTVAIIGAGAVGVELACEIRDKYPVGTNKRIMLVDMAPTILPGLEPSSVRYATKWLKNNGVELYLGSPLKAMDPKSITFANGTTVQVDVIYKCIGAAPQSTFLMGSTELVASLQGPKGAVVVNDYLQVKGHTHVFCAGDLCFHGKSNELKLAHTAEMNAELVAKNIMRMTKQDDGMRQQSCSTLLTYPRGVVGNSVTPKIYCLSLGKYDATLGFNQLVINGSIGAVMKWLIEWTSVAAAAQRPIGNVFWMIAHFTSNLLSRTVLPPSHVPTKDKAT